MANYFYSTIASANPLELYYLFCKLNLSFTALGLNHFNSRELQIYVGVHSY